MRGKNTQSLKVKNITYIISELPFTSHPGNQASQVREEKKGNLNPIYLIASVYLQNALKTKQRNRRLTDLPGIHKFDTLVIISEVKMFFTAFTGDHF